MLLRLRALAYLPRVNPPRGAQPRLPVPLKSLEPEEPLPVSMSYGGVDRKQIAST